MTPDQRQQVADLYSLLAGFESSADRILDPLQPLVSVLGNFVVQTQVGSGF